MAKQCGPIRLTGTVQGICFYTIEGKAFVRMKNSLTRKLVMNDPAFRRTREYAALLGKAPKIASGVYRQITGERKKHSLYQEMTGKAMRMLREGKEKEVVVQDLFGRYLEKEAGEKFSEKK